MLWLGGLHALDLTTSTPDALCPPLEEARAVVKARVGEVRGDFHAEFGLIRRDDGSQALQLVLREGVQQVLRRELPLDEAGCEDAAQAIALVLERHFDAIDRPDTPEPAPRAQPQAVPATPDQQAAQVAPIALPPAPEPMRSWRVRAGLLYDGELGPAPVLGLTVYPQAFELGSGLRIGAALDVAPFLRRRTQTVRDQEVALTTLQVAVSLPVTLQLPAWELSLGPWAHWRLQRGQAPSRLHGEVAYRALPGLGGFAQVVLKLGPSWSLLGATAFGAQIPGAAAGFFLQKDSGERNAVLVPQSWFAQAQLAAMLSF